jgi:hypothetical protein
LGGKQNKEQAMIERQTLDFEPIDEHGESCLSANRFDWHALVAFFDCYGCGASLFFRKEYDAFQYLESLLARAKNVKCPRCGTVHRHMTEVDDDGEWVDLVKEEFVDPNQLKLFEG